MQWYTCTLCLIRRQYFLSPSPLLPFESDFLSLHFLKRGISSSFHLVFDSYVISWTWWLLWVSFTYKESGILSVKRNGYLSYVLTSFVVNGYRRRQHNEVKVSSQGMTFLCLNAFISSCRRDNIAFYSFYVVFCQRQAISRGQIKAVLICHVLCTHHVMCYAHIMSYSDLTWESILILSFSCWLKSRIISGDQSFFLAFEFHPHISFLTRVFLC